VTDEQLAQRLHARRSGRGWIAPCPAHNDRSPSLSIGEGSDGRLLLHCFGGCSTESIVSKLGLSMSDLFAEPRALRQARPPEVRASEKHVVDLRSRLTPRERVLRVTVVIADRASLDAAIGRALALGVEGELVQVAAKERGS